ncbi:MAG: rod shape-determining protein MreD [Flavobacteriales bacterium]|nr:rod shape-determining protein MreD [Flavobacteriales bacterium]|tara:strand:+ start:451 stop:969 length:519 start_codon:yes stop_codon:yes gene_type:complete
MISSVIRYPLLFIFFVMLQVLILNNIQLSGYINPYLYIIFILWLPVDGNKVLLMAVSMLLGLSVDIFSNSVGMHASACVFLAFCRPYILQSLAPRDGYETDQVPDIKTLGLNWFLAYAGICVLLHHLFLFYVEIFRFDDFFSTLGRVISSSIFTLILIIIAQLFRYNPSRRI